MPIDETCIIAEHAESGPGYMLLTLAAPRLAPLLVPGQFVHVRVPALEATALRRPFSVFDAENGRLKILYKKVGRGTAALATAKPGEALRVLGPLGRGFPGDCNAVPVLVGGGYGVAPLHFLAKRLVAKGRSPAVFCGGRTKDDLLALEDFAALGADVRIATNDGSAGTAGFVTAPLDDFLRDLEAGKRAFELFACGPDGLLKAVADRALGHGAKGWISMDRHMVCGAGACFACIQRVRRPDGTEHNARCCVNGPVFKAEEIVW